jgi:hypothetical protein
MESFYNIKPLGNYSLTLATVLTANDSTFATISMTMTCMIEATTYVQQIYHLIFWCRCTYACALVQQAHNDNGQLILIFWCRCTYACALVQQAHNDNGQLMWSTCLPDAFILLNSLFTTLHTDSGLVHDKLLKNWCCDSILSPGSRYLNSQDIHCTELQYSRVQNEIRA